MEASARQKIYAQVRRERPDWSAMQAARVAAYYPRLTPDDGGEADGAAESEARELAEPEQSEAEPETAAIDLDNGSTRMAREVRAAFGARNG